MEAAVEAERARYRELAERYGKALLRTNSLQYELAAWIFRDAEVFSPERFAQMFYARDDRFQAAFFNVMQAQITAHHDALPEETVWGKSPGVPPGEAQWWHMAQHLDASGLETLEAMVDHARHHAEAAVAEERERSLEA
jgi:hypothetical protein